MWRCKVGVSGKWSLMKESEKYKWRETGVKSSRSNLKAHLIKKLLRWVSEETSEAPPIYFVFSGSHSRWICQKVVSSLRFLFLTTFNLPSCQGVAIVKFGFTSHSCQEYLTFFLRNIWVQFCSFVRFLLFCFYYCCVFIYFQQAAK